jgi:uncharacterized protein YndB with AHSA1/START domain
MKRIDRTIHTDQPAEKVWDYLAEFDHTNEWDPATVRTERRSGDGGTGSTYHNVSTFLGRETELTYTVVGLDPHTQIRFRGENDSVTAHDTITVAAAPDGGTTVHYVAEFELHGASKLATPVLDLPLKKLGDDAGERLTEVLAGL